MKKPNSLDVYRVCSSASLSAQAYMSTLLKYISWRNSGSRMQIILLLLCTIAMPFAVFAQKPAISLEQIRNGAAAAPVSPGAWQNGNLNASQAHFVESHSIPYRALMIKMPTGISITLELGFDIKHSGRNALDYLTHYDRLQPHGQFLTGGQHPAQEVIDPTIGTSFAGLAPTSEFTIPAPYGGGSTSLQNIAVTSYNTKVEANKKVMTLWGGTITDIQYVSPYGDLTAAQSEQKIKVTFTLTDPSPVLAWGGHIANRQDWGNDADGVPLSAGGISGSPYHMRILGWTLGNLGQQDRSLAAAAVIPPPACDLTGPAQACINQSKQYTTAVIADTYTWSILDNTSGATITDGQNSPTLTVNSGTQAGSYSVKLVTVKNGITSTDDCRIVVNVSNPQTNDVTDREHCPGESGSAINFSGTAGSTFHWSSDVNVGFGTSGTGNIPAYTAIANNTNAPIVATVTVYATLNGCDGPSQTFTVTVNPTPQTNDVTDREHCAGEQGSAIAFSGTAGSTFHWSSDVNVGFGTSGTGNISAYTVIDNNTDAPIVATVTVYATLNGCTGPSQTFTVTVKPTPQTNDISDRAYCAGEQGSAINFSGTAGATFHWSSNVNVGFGTSGTGNISAYSVINTNVTVVATVTVYATLNGCTGPSQTFTVTVNPNPVAIAGNDPDPQCYNEPSNTFPLNGSGSNGTPLWTVQNNPNGLTVNIADANAFQTMVSVSGGAGSVTLRLTVTSVYEPSCGSDFDDVVLTINEEPTAPAVNYIPPACDEAVFKVQVMNPILGATYYIMGNNGEAPASIEVTLAGQEVIFENRPAGSGYQVSVENASGCTSGVNSCGDATSQVSMQLLESAARLRATTGGGDAKLSVYPMPFDQKMTLTYQIKNDGNYSISLYDMTGRMIRTLKTGIGKAGLIEQIEVEGISLKNGMYMIAVRDGKKLQTIRVIKKQ